MKIPKIAIDLAKSIGGRLLSGAAVVAVDAVQGKDPAKRVDAKRLKRHVSKIEKLIGKVEDQLGQTEVTGISIGELHEALFIGLAVLEDEIGERLLGDAPATGDVTIMSGGSGKERPNVTDE